MAIKEIITFQLTDKDIKRFWSKVQIWWPRACWLWSAGKRRRSYGAFWLNGHTVIAHRISYAIYFSEIPDGLYVLHSCDTPACCNPAHLFLGTNQDNIADRHAKGRDAKGLTSGRHTKPERTARGDKHGSRLFPGSLRRGESHGRSKLNITDIKQIRESCKNWNDAICLAKTYNVNKSHIWRIVNRISWAHID